MVRVCPNCNSTLFVNEDCPASDYPELTLWWVECSKCDWLHTEPFLLEEEAKEFIK